MRITLKIWKFFKRNIPSPALKIPHSHPRYTDNPFRVEVRVGLGSPGFLQEQSDYVRNSNG